MRNHLFLLAFTSMVFFTNCISTKRILKKETEKVDFFSIDKINGEYLNSCINNSSKELLWDTLYELKYSKKDTTSINENTIIKLNYNDSKNLTITALENNKVINEFKIKAFIKKNYLSLKRRLLLVPIPFIFFKHKENKIILGVLENGNLILKYGKEESLWILMMAAGHDWTNSLIFPKKTTFFMD